MNHDAGRPGPGRVLPQPRTPIAPLHRRQRLPQQPHSLLRRARPGERKPAIPRDGGFNGLRPRRVFLQQKQGTAQAQDAGASEAFVAKALAFA
jgi:hypothetical protein